MTFSIVGRSSDGQMYGVAVASRFLAVGALVPAAEADVGGIATQAHANLAFGPQGLTMLRTGASAADTVAALSAADAGRVQRQLGVVASQGEGATYTGAACADWAGGHAGDGFAVQGNILTGPEVVDAMRDAWLESVDKPFARRLLAALTAGDLAGGDRRGRQSAAILVVGKGTGYGGTGDVAMDLRVDDHGEPVAELKRLADLHDLHFDKPDPDEILYFDAQLSSQVGELLRRLGHSGELENALHEWAGMTNLEERMVAGGIDPIVLQALHQAAERPPE